MGVRGAEGERQRRNVRLGKLTARRLPPTSVQALQERAPVEPQAVEVDALQTAATSWSFGGRAAMSGELAKAKSTSSSTICHQGSLRIR